MEFVLITYRTNAILGEGRLEEVPEPVDARRGGEVAAAQPGVDRGEDEGSVGGGAPRVLLMNAPSDLMLNVHRRLLIMRFDLGRNGL